jgi:protein phosphatase
MDKPQLRFAQATDTGSNNDSSHEASLALTMHGASNFGITDIGFFMIADSMDISEDGKRAAELTIQTAAQEMVNRLYLPSVSSSANKQLETVLDTAFQQANVALRHHYPEIGIAATAMLVVGNTVHVMHIGNARVYLVADEVEQLTRDQILTDSFAEHDLNLARHDTPSTRVLAHPMLGLSEAVHVETTTRKIMPGTRLLLCSDGLIPPVEDGNMNSSLQQIVLRQPNLKRACELVISLARAKESQNELSLILVKVGG